MTGASSTGTGDDFTQLLVVPTDAGRYRATVSRSSTSGPWLVSQLVPIESKR